MARNAPDPHYWTLNSCFDAFLSVRVHFGPLRYCTKLGAKCTKLVQLMQKFVQRCLVRFFEMNAPDPHHWTLNSFFGAFLSVWVHLEPFRDCTKLGANGQPGAINARVRATKSRQNFSRPTLPIHTI